MPDKRAATLIAIASLGQRTSYLKGLWTRGFPSKHVKRQTTGRSGRIRKNPRATESGGGTVVLSRRGARDNRLTLKPYQQAQARFSTGARGLGMPSTEARRMSVSIGSRVGTLQLRRGLVYYKYILTWCAHKAAQGLRAQGWYHRHIKGYKVCSDRLLARTAVSRTKVRMWVSLY